MDLPKNFARRGVVLYLQIAAAVVSLLLGIAQMTKESQPLVQKMQERLDLGLMRRHQAEAQRKAHMIASMGIKWQFRGHDGTWRYYSDPTSRYWSRVNIYGVHEYSENPQTQMASNPTLVR